MPPFDTPRPDSSDAWDRRKIELRETLWQLLGDLPPRPVPDVTVRWREERDGYTLEHFTFDNGVGDTVYGYVLIPAGHRRPLPAILYHHYHGNRYAQGKQEVLTRAFAHWPGGLGLITGEELARAGYVVMCIDAYGFGQRMTQGPAGEREKGVATETSLFKTFLWQGRTLWGMIVRDDLLALDYLTTRPEVDPQRIAAMGMSMGSTRTWWAAALDERIRVAVSVACLTRYQDLIATGNVAAHGIYYYVPGMLQQQIDTESVVGLIAPRPHLTLTGDSDTGSPAEGVRTINAFGQHVYRLYNKADHFRGLLYEGVGHVYTPAMWQETLRWLGRFL
ncbi:MAG: acetylxylan esterase [Candidatus Nealsonbacteria bacterium]|nr:acetylxylan esterase [Candidatus Nealsonbacteria bacterium]